MEPDQKFLLKQTSIPPQGRRKRIGQRKDPLAIQLNKQLQSFKLKIYEVLEQVKLQRYDITANNLKLALSGNLFQTHTITQIYKLFIENLSNRIGYDYSPASLEINKTTYDHLLEFLYQEGKSQLKPREFNNHQFLKFEQYLKSKKRHLK